ncbi:mandelate racemase/muconate lactonizing enzyme family protein [Burkholderia sp. BCC0405]|uniref:mandelate racemase/muconate lactonizing enzyme family protein n=1 Tax=Burkholderia sp. BCC0405 TaxID=2676298 RepID=UPI00158CB043|nr:mandelate racemase/muconate lactonizing enzyme family protein [Burkholderia sp. BCC0405]
MSKAPVIEAVSLTVVEVTPATRWTFVRLLCSSGDTGIGEATLTGREPDLIKAFEPLAPMIKGKTTQEIDSSLCALPLASLPQAAIVSAFSHAYADLDGRRQSRGAAALFGEPCRDVVPLYANINRRTRQRDADAFAASAVEAISAGFSAIKIAPFDGVELYGDPVAEIDREKIRIALDRIGAVRNAIGNQHDLMVDCHWRLNPSAAREILASEECNGLHWFECPIPETRENLTELSALRAFANRRGIRLAGCEEAIRVNGLLPFVEAGAYDVLMPDIKYIGGMKEMLTVARMLEKHGLEISPHNPSGPVAHVASLHMAALMPNLGRLELQFDETTAFTNLVASGLPRPTEGQSKLPEGTGLGLQFDHAEVAARSTLYIEI